MLRTVQHGDVFVLESGVGTGARLGCGCFAVGALLTGPLLVLMAVLPPREVTLECDRAAGTCKAKAWTRPLADVEGAVISSGQRGGRSFRVRTTTFGLKLKGEQFSVCTAPNGDPAVDALESDVKQLNAFLADSSAPKLTLTCKEDIETLGERIYYPIVGGSFFVGALYVLRMLRRRHLEVDAAKRKIRVWGPGVRRRELSPEQLEGVELSAGVLKLRVVGEAPVVVASARPSDSAEPLAQAKAKLEAMRAQPSASM